MFRIVFTLLAIMTLAFCEIEWIGSLAEAKKQSKKLKKPILVFATVESCPYCVIMKNTTMSDEKVLQYISNNFVPFLLYPSKGEYPRGSNIDGVPTIMVYDYNENKLAPNIAGLMGPDELLERLQGINKK